MEMFASMNSKLRFLTAKKLGRVDVQRIAAVEMIQIEWRAKIARKRFRYIYTYFFFIILLFLLLKFLFILYYSFKLIYLLFIEHMKED